MRDLSYAQNITIEPANSLSWPHLTSSANLLTHWGRTLLLFFVHAHALIVALFWCLHHYNTEEETFDKYERQQQAAQSALESVAYKGLDLLFVLQVSPCLTYFRIEGPEHESPHRCLHSRNLPLSFTERSIL